MITMLINSLAYNSSGRNNCSIPRLLWTHFYRTSHSATSILRKPVYMSTKLRGPTSRRQPAVCIIISVRSSNVTTTQFPGTSKRVHLPRSVKCSVPAMWSGVLSYYSWIFRAYSPDFHGRKYSAYETRNVYVSLRIYIYLTFFSAELWH